MTETDHRYLHDYLSEDGPRLTLPGEAYRSVSLFEHERERIFRHAWVLAGRAAEFGVGHYVSLVIADEPVVVTRDESGTLRALSSVCRHRFMPLVHEERGHVRRFECGYHLWTYRLDGTLAGAPHMKTNRAFDATNCTLPRFAVQEWQGFVFVNLDPAAPSLADELAPLDERLARYRLAEAVPIATYQATWTANWKIIIENVSEAYHHAGFHPASVEPVAPSRLANDTCEAADSWVSFRSPLTPPADPPVALSLDEQNLDAIAFYNVLPCLQFFTYGEIVVWARYLPESVDRTRVTSGVLAPPGLGSAEELATLGRTYGDFITAINAEDQAGVEAVQRGAQSRLTGRGHLSGKESAILAFYRYLARRLVDVPAVVGRSAHANG